MQHTHRHILAVILLAAITFLGSGCTAMFIADQVVPKEPQDLPNDIRIDVPYIEQTDSFCGPASLAMVANYYGIEVTPNEIASLVYIPERKGTLQIEMTAAARKLELVPYTMQMDVEALRTEINAERPVIVLRNLALDVYPVWHYSVVAGRSHDDQHLLLHSGRHEFYRVNLDTFKRTWQRASQWALVVAPVGDIPTSADEQTVLKSAINLEKIGQPRMAQLTYEAALHRWPDSFGAYVGLANTHMVLNEPLAASHAYRKALALNTHSSAALNNFAHSAYALGCEVTAIHAAQCAVQLEQIPNQEIVATLKELRNKTNNPTNHINCPNITCKGERLAVNP